VSPLKRGTLCMIVAGCPENIGLLVTVLDRLGPRGVRGDAYRVRTVTGQRFHQFSRGDLLVRGWSSDCITDRHTLRPVVEDSGAGDAGPGRREPVA